jgi:hypothetical protein
MTQKNRPLVTPPSLLPTLLSLAFIVAGREFTKRHEDLIKKVSKI